MSDFLRFLDEKLKGFPKSTFFDRKSFKNSVIF